MVLLADFMSIDNMLKSPSMQCTLVILYLYNYEIVVNVKSKNSLFLY